MGRVILAGIAGGFAMYVAMSIFHMSPVAQIGFSQMTNDAPALAALQDATGDKPGLYIYPTVDMNSKDAMAKAEAARKVKPSGILIYQRAGSPGMTPKLLITELLIEIAQAIVAAGLLSVTAIASYSHRVLFVTATGFVCAITTNMSYWNWYAFPLNYTLANMGIEIVGFLAAGLAMAAIVKPRRV